MQEKLLKKIEELKKSRIEFQKNVIAIEGALMVCEELLKEIEKEEKNG